VDKSMVLKIISVPFYIFLIDMRNQNLSVL
jgi:hypothetical protein